MRISRPCYDKYRRCPGWAGPGFKYAKVEHCDNGFITFRDSPRWKWLIHRCPKCQIIVLPYYIRWADPTWYRFVVDWEISRLRYLMRK